MLSSEEAVTERLALSIPEAAKALGISRNHAYTMAAKGEIPTKTFGKRRVVPVEALKAILLPTVTSELENP
jgi:excisionase family DNA binding protein